MCALLMVARTLCPMGVNGLLAHGPMVGLLVIRSEYCGRLALRDVSCDAMSRPRLRQALLQRYPWLGEHDIGPRSVVAGDCDRCGAEARMVAPCGPPPGDLRHRAGPDWALGRRCTADLDDRVWCGGHAREGEQARAWLADLPAEADTVARLWWVSTGEIGIDPGLLAAALRLRLPAGDDS